MDNAAVMEQIVKNLAFEVEAVPDNLVEVTGPSGATPLNVKIRVRKKDDSILQPSTLALQKVAKANTKPQKIKVINSDQTIMSFNLIMDDTDHDKPIKSTQRPLFRNICLGTDTSSTNFPYMPSSTLKEGEDSIGSQSDGAIKSRYSASKVESLKSSPTMSKKKNNDIFGTCKPGGCLDPPFEEDKHPYELGKTSPLRHDTKTRRSPSIFSNKLFKKKRKSKTDRLSKTFNDDSDANLDQVDSEPAALEYSNSILTYPSPLDGSEQRPQEKRISQNFEQSSFYLPPKKERKRISSVDQSVETTAVNTERERPSGIISAENITLIKSKPKEEKVHEGNISPILFLNLAETETISPSKENVDKSQKSRNKPNCAESKIENILLPHPKGSQKSVTILPEIKKCVISVSDENQTSDENLDINESAGQIIDEIKFFSQQSLQLPQTLSGKKISQKSDLGELSQTVDDTMKRKLESEIFTKSSENVIGSRKYDESQYSLPLSAQKSALRTGPSEHLMEKPNQTQSLKSEQYIEEKETRGKDRDDLAMNNREANIQAMVEQGYGESMQGKYEDSQFPLQSLSLHSKTPKEDAIRKQNISTPITTQQSNSESVTLREKAPAYPNQTKDDSDKKHRNHPQSQSKESRTQVIYDEMQSKSREVFQKTYSYGALSNEDRVSIQKEDTLSEPSLKARRSQPGLDITKDVGNLSSEMTTKSKDVLNKHSYAAVSIKETEQDKYPVTLQPQQSKLSKKSAGGKSAKGSQLQFSQDIDGISITDNYKKIALKQTNVESDNDLLNNIDKVYANNIMRQDIKLNEQRGKETLLPAPELLETQKQTEMKIASSNGLGKQSLRRDSQINILGQNFDSMVHSKKSLQSKEDSLLRSEKDFRQKSLEYRTPSANIGSLSSKYDQEARDEDNENNKANPALSQETNVSDVRIGTDKVESIITEQRLSVMKESIITNKAREPFVTHLRKTSDLTRENFKDYTAPDQPLKITSSHFLENLKTVGLTKRLGSLLLEDNDVSKVQDIHVIPDIHDESLDTTKTQTKLKSYKDMKIRSSDTFDDLEYNSVASSDESNTYISKDIRSQSIVSSKNTVRLMNSIPQDLDIKRIDTKSNNLISDQANEFESNIYSQGINSISKNNIAKEDYLPVSAADSSIYSKIEKEDEGISLREGMKSLEADNNITENKSREPPSLAPEKSYPNIRKGLKEFSLSPTDNYSLRDSTKSETASRDYSSIESSRRTSIGKNVAPNIPSEHVDEYSVDKSDTLALKVGSTDISNKSQDILNQTLLFDLNSEESSFKVSKASSPVRFLREKLSNIDEDSILKQKFQSLSESRPKSDIISNTLKIHEGPDGKEQIKHKENQQPQDREANLRKDQPIIVDLGFRSFVNERNERIIKTFDGDLSNRYSNETIVVAKSDMREPFDMRIPTDSDNYLYVKLETNKAQSKFQLGKDDHMDNRSRNKNIVRAPGANEATMFKNKYMDRGEIKNILLRDRQIETACEDIQTALSELYRTYEKELVPLQDTITELKKDVELLTKQQMLYRETLLINKRIKRIRSVTTRKCGCIKKI